MQLTDADKVYEAFFTGCALAGPEGCSIASAGQTPLDVNNNIQQLLQAAHDATRANSSVPVTSGQIRSTLDRSLYTAPIDAEADCAVGTALLRAPIMYNPTTWQPFVDTTWPQLVQEVHDESGGSTTRRRQCVQTILFCSPNNSRNLCSESVLF